MNTCGWVWKENEQHSSCDHQLHDLMDDDTMIAWVESRPSYCDRGHWKMMVDAPCGLDGQDGFPRYFMRLEVAKQEAEDFLMWRLHKVRAEL